MKLKSLFKIFILVVVIFTLYLVLFEKGSLSNFRDQKNKKFQHDNKIGGEVDIGMEEVSPKAVSLSVKDSLNLKVDTIYVVNFSLKVTVPSELRKRQKLIAKFNKKTLPATGWAIAIRRVESSSRFEIYLLDSKENGGWFSFSAIDLLENQFYEITFVINPGNFMTGYIKAEGEAETKVIEMGTLSLADLHDIDSIDNLQVTSGNPKNDVFSGSIKNVSIFKFDKLPSKKNLLKALSKGSDKFLEPYADSCVISFASKKYRCEIEH